MGKNILILTHEYSSDTKPNERWTKVVSYFAKEWAKENRVIVVVDSSKFPKFYYLFGGLLRWVAKHNSKDPALITDQTWRKNFEFNDGEIKVYNRPMLKFFPHGKYYRFHINRQVNDIISILAENNFNPDIIDGHWLNPQIDLIPELGKYYGAKTALVLHREAVSPQYYTKSIEQKLNCIDKIGCRSKTGAMALYDNLSLREMPFTCSSGIPDRFVENAISDKTIFSNSQIQIVTVSRLMDWKCIDAAIEGIDTALRGKDYNYVIIGDGPEKEKLQTMINDRGITDKVHLIGKIPREQVLERLKVSDFFVLISKRETFGLVYLEAMLQGCIAIGSENGGIDGIIEHGKNGFLVPEGDSGALSQCINSICSLNADDMQDISQNAITTAVDYTDSKVAARYLAEIS